MTFYIFVRRLHLYLGMFLLPWFFMYGISSVIFSHGQFFQQLHENDGPQWTVRFDRAYDIPVPQNADPEEIGARILRDNGIRGAFGVHRPNQRELSVYVSDFWSATRMTYFINEKRLLAEDRKFRWESFLTGMHARGGFERASTLNDAWGVVVDIVCIGILLWIASGLYMWWKLPKTRAWGYAALGGGLLCFAIFLLAL